MSKRTRTVDALLVLQGECCYVCNEAIREDAFDVDHKVRLADGGSDEISNKCVLCLPCHRKKTRRENTTTPPFFNYNATGVNELVKAKQNEGEKQIHQRYTLHQIRDWWVDGALEIAECNRDAVWDMQKRRAFLTTLLEGGIIPPFFFNVIRETGKREIYDGGNRMTTIMDFMDGKIHVQFPQGRRTVHVSYAPCQIERCNVCFRMDTTNRRIFGYKTIDVFEWDNLSKDAACEMAQHLNEGTPMSIGEKLKLLCGRNTPRARILKYLYESETFQALVVKDRERDRKMLALLLRKTICPEVPFSSHLTSNFAPLDNFYKSHDPVDEKHVAQTERILSDTVRSLQGRIITSRNTLICIISLLSEKEYDLQGALHDTDTECTVEDLLERHLV